MREPSSRHNDGGTRFVMSVRRFLAILVPTLLMCGSLHSARAQNASPKAAPKPAVAKPDAKPTASPAAAVAVGAEPTLLGQFGTWGAYAAGPNGKKICLALGKPSQAEN